MSWFGFGALCALVLGLSVRAADYPSPLELRYTADGSSIVVTDPTLQKVQWIDVAGAKLGTSSDKAARSANVAFGPDGSVWAADYLGNSVMRLGADGKVASRVAVGWRPGGLAIAPKRGWLLACNVASNDVSMIQLSDGKEVKRVKVVREPYRIAITPDEKLAVVSNLIAGGVSTDPEQTTCVSLIDLETGQCVNVKLPPNATCARNVAISPDGKWAYVVHTTGRSNLPATQLDRGWVNTNAMSIIDLGAKSLYTTVLLDSLYEGAADPWGIALSKDGATMWITISGTHQLAKISLGTLHQLLSGQANPPAGGEGATRVWAEIRKNPAKRMDLVTDLAAMHVANLIQRIKLPGKGPRGIDVSPDGSTLAVAMHFSGQVLLLDSTEAKVKATIAMGPTPAIEDARRGEMIFHDANYAFQQWLSCATCHPNNGRVDGLNWDLPNDGIGNPKNNKSLLYAHLTPPSMWLGIREGMDEAVMAGFRFSARQPEQQDLQAVRAYIRSLRPEPSPYRPAPGQFSEKAQKGKAIFETEEVGCVHCHPAPLYTSLKRYNVGTHGQLDHQGEDAFDTPSLIEAWRTAPYLHDGRAATLEEIFTKFNPDNKHGHTSKLTGEQIADLAEYLNSIDDVVEEKSVGSR
jgi:DNA-binding beta-propeller fold protein YncE